MAAAEVGCSGHALPHARHHPLRPAGKLTSPVGMHADHESEFRPQLAENARARSLGRVGGLQDAEPRGDPCRTGAVNHRLEIRSKGLIG